MPRTRTLISACLATLVAFVPALSAQTSATTAAHDYATAHRDGSFVRFSVVDTGPGIPADEIAHLFDRFYQTRDNRQKSKGLGLGLAICKGLVAAHGGRIWVESLPGAGSGFNFTLPAALVTETSSAARE